MTTQINRPVELISMHAIALELLQNPEFGLKNAAVAPEDADLVDKAIALVKAVNDGESVDREQWTGLKRDSLKFVGSPVADCVSRICSAERTPEIALSGLRDAAEKVIEVAANLQHDRIKTLVQQRIQDFL